MKSNKKSSLFRSLLHMQRSKFYMFAFLLLSFCSVVLISFGKLKLGVDFAGGIVVNFSTSSNVNVQNFDEFDKRLQKSLQGYSFDMQISNNGYISLRFNDANLSESNNVDIIKSKIIGVFEDVKFDNIDSIGPQMSKGLIKQSITAIIFAMIAIAVYLIIQFNIYFAISGVIVLICDVLISIGFAIVFGFELNLTLIAAFLTLIGYCVNDTVVLYDRIRTNGKRRPKEKIELLFRSSVKEVLPRSFATSIVTIIGVSGILFFSDKSIVNFAWTVMFGIVVGTFGSVFVASYIPLMLKMKYITKPPKVKDKMFYSS